MPCNIIVDCLFAWLGAYAALLVKATGAAAFVGSS